MLASWWPPILKPPTQHPKRNFSVRHCKHVSTPGTSHFPVTGCISLEKQPYPPLTLNPFTLVQQLYTLPTINIPFPWLRNPSCLYTRWSCRFQSATEIVSFLRDIIFPFEKLIIAKLIKKFAFFLNLKVLYHVHKNFHIWPCFKTIIHIWHINCGDLRLLSCGVWYHECLLGDCKHSGRTWYHHLQNKICPSASNLKMDEVGSSETFLNIDVCQTTRRHAPEVPSHSLSPHPHNLFL